MSSRFTNFTATTPNPSQALMQALKLMVSACRSATPFLDQGGRVGISPVKYGMELHFTMEFGTELIHHDSWNDVLVLQVKHTYCKMYCLSHPFHLNVKFKQIHNRPCISQYWYLLRSKGYKKGRKIRKNQAIQSPLHYPNAFGFTWSNPRFNNMISACCHPSGAIALMAALRAARSPRSLGMLEYMGMDA